LDFKTKMNVGKYFTLEEFVASEYAARNGIENKPDAWQIENIRKLCENVLDPLREKVNRPVIITSGFRSEELNRAIGGVKISQHLSGEAADIIIIGMHPQEVFGFIRSNLIYDQVILEYNQWTHVSYSACPRKQALIMERVEGKSICTPA
jgi:hypothetical protein